MAYAPWTTELRNTHSKQTKNVIDKFKRAFHAIEPEILYHYSKQDKLISILKSNFFRASSIKKLNDYSEYSYGISLAKELILQKKYDEDFVKLLLNKIHDYIDLSNNIFVLSLSVNGDSLPLWQMYSDAEFKGYNLGFYSAFLDFSYSLCHGNVIYSRPEQERILYKLLDAFQVYYRDTKGITDNSFFDFVNKWHWDELISYFTLFKHRGFSYEEEYRVVYYITPCNEYQINGRDSDKPYIEIPTVSDDEDQYDLPLCEITLGPKNISSDNEVRSIFQVERLGNVEIKRSEIPFR